MKALFSRYGGYSVRIGHGKASDEKLPEDQSLDNMLNDYSEEIMPDVIVLSSYDLRPVFMGAMANLPTKAIKLGTVYHQFLEILLQHELEVATDIYVMTHEYSNVFALIIKTRKDELEWVFDDYVESYDYIQTTFFRGAETKEDESLSKNPRLTEIMLYVLFFKMGFTYSSFNFEPSKTVYGKKVSKEFTESLKDFYKDISSVQDLSKELLKKFPRVFNNKSEN